MKALIPILLFVSNALHAQQHTIAQFVVWKPKEGQAKNFETGYKHHLGWHKENGDSWNWYGWYFTSGSRVSQFMDATFGHAWSDFDNAVKPAEDRADNELHVFPFADLQSVFKVSALPTLSIADSGSLKSTLLRLVTMRVTDITKGIGLIEKLKTMYQADLHVKTFLPFKVVDGGEINQILLLLGFTSNEAYGKTENIQEDIVAIEALLKTDIVTSLTSETLRYRADMSYFPK